MTVDTMSYILTDKKLAKPQYSCGMSQVNSHFKASPTIGKTSSELHTEARHDNIDKEHQKNESRTNFNCSDTHLRSGGLSSVEDRLGTALHMGGNNTERVVAELVAASERLQAYNGMINRLVSVEASPPPELCLVNTRRR